MNGISLFYGNPDAARNIRGAGCAHCHGGPKTYIELYHNNGLNAPDNFMLGLTDREKKDLLAFLHILTDSTFITDKRFSNPFR